MPEMDGNEVANTISEIKWQCPRQYQLLRWRHATADEEKRCLSNGMNDYLSKPSDFNVLLENYTLT
jgi:CheY-like chemotaxis protein